MLCVGCSIQLKGRNGSTHCFLFAVERKEVFKIQDGLQQFEGKPVAGPLADVLLCLWLVPSHLTHTRHVSL